MCTKDPLELLIHKVVQFKLFRWFTTQNRVLFQEHNTMGRYQLYRQNLKRKILWIFCLVDEVSWHWEEKSIDYRYSQLNINSLRNVLVMSSVFVLLFVLFVWGFFYVFCYLCAWRLFFVFLRVVFYYNNEIVFSCHQSEPQQIVSVFLYSHHILIITVLMSVLFFTRTVMRFVTDNNFCIKPRRLTP